MMRGFSPSELAVLMKLSDKLSALNAARFVEWNVDHQSNDLLPGSHAFNGDVTGDSTFERWTLTALDRLSERVRILSGLYGILRPFDAVRPYRLEMEHQLKGQPLPSLPISGKSE